MAREFMNHDLEGEGVSNPNRPRNFKPRELVEQGVPSMIDPETGKRLPRIPEFGAKGLVGEGRPPGMSEEIRYLPTEAERRDWLNEELDRLESNWRNSFGENEIGRLFYTLMENLHFAKDIQLPVEIDRQLTEPEAKVKEALIKKKAQEYLKEIEARYQLHNLHQLMRTGDFGKIGSAGLLHNIEDYLPLLFCLPGVEQALEEYQQNEYEIFRQDPVTQKRFTQKLIDKVGPNGQKVGPVGQRLAERILHSLGVSVTASLIFDEKAKEFQKTGLQTREQKLQVLRQLPWERQKEIVNFKASFGGDTPFDLSKVLFYGYRLEKSALDEEGLGNPKTMAKMRKNMLFSVDSYLATAKKDTDKRSPTVKELVKNMEEKKEGLKPENKDVFADFYDKENLVLKVKEDDLPLNIRALSPGARGTFFQNLSWEEQVKYIDVSETIKKVSKLRSTGLGFIWALRLSGFKGVIEGLEKGFLARPSAAGITEALQPVHSLLRDEKERVSAIIGQNTFEYLTESQAAYFPVKNQSKEEAATIFDILSSNGLITPITEEKLKDKNLGNKYWRTFTDIMFRKLKWGKALWATYWTTLGAFFKAVFGGGGR